MSYEDTDYDHDFELEEIQSEFHRKEVIQSIMVPGISLLVHVAVFVVLLLVFVSQVVEDEKTVTVQMVPEAPEEPIQEEEQIEELQNEEVSEQQESENETPVEDTFSEMPVEDSTPVEDVSDLMAFNVQLPSTTVTNSSTSFLAGRRNAGSAAPNAVNSAINKGLAWLAKQQKSDGTFQIGDHPNAKWGACTLAFLGNGNSTTKGKYKHVVKKSVDAMLARVDKDPNFKKMMHSFATPFVVMALLDAAALEPEDQKLRKGAQKALDYAIRTQQANGGWSGGGQSASKNSSEVDITATAWWTMAVISGKLAGFDVPQQTFDKTLGLLKDVMNDEFKGKLIVAKHGGKSVSFNQKYSISALALTLTQFLGERPDSPVVKLALKGLAQNRVEFKKSNYWTLYKQGIGTFQLGRDSSAWERFALDYIRPFMAEQKSNGSWSNKNSFKERGRDSHNGVLKYWGDEGTTAMAILNLQVYFRYGSVHDMYQRHGRIVSQRGKTNKTVTPAKKVVVVQEEEIELDFL